MPNERMTVDEYKQMPKAHKYHARPVVVDNIRFDSRREAGRYTELKLLERAKSISNLQTQVRYPLEVNGIIVSHYVADFKYFDTVKKVWVVEDAKGFVTDLYRLKKKLVRALFGIEILET
jgi:hypothetical protein